MYQYTEKNRFPNRKYPRLKNFDYSQKNFYFITICTDQKKCIFGTPQALNHFGEIVQGSLNNIEKHYAGIRIDKYVIMPNHIHIIFEVIKNETDLFNAIGSFKSAVTKKIHETDAKLKVWQRSFYDHVIRDQKSYEKIWNYIETNPMKWEEDCFYQQ